MWTREGRKALVDKSFLLGDNIMVSRHILVLFLFFPRFLSFKNQEEGLERWLQLLRKMEVLPEDLSSVTSSHMVVHSLRQFQFQRDLMPSPGLHRH